MQANTSWRVAVVRGGSRRIEQDQPGVDVGHRPEHAARHRAREAHVGVPGGLDARHAVGRDAGGAASRSATSSCTITRTRCRRGEEPRGSCSTTGTEMLYGRLATRAVGWGPGSSRTASASARTTVEPVGQRRRVQRRRCPAAHRRAPGRPRRRPPRPTTGSSARVSDPRPGPTSTTVSSGADAGQPHDPPHGVGVDDEVLAPLLGRADAQCRAGELADLAGAQQGPVPDGWACDASSFMPSSLGGTHAAAPEPQRVRGPHAVVTSRGVRRRARNPTGRGRPWRSSGSATVICCSRDGEVGARGEVGAAVGQPRRAWANCRPP